MIVSLSSLNHIKTKFARCFSISHIVCNAAESYKFVVLGGGSGGISMASSLARKFPKQVAVIEPSNDHFYQPIWTLVGAGLKDAKESVRPMVSVMPKKSVWIQEKVAGIEPGENYIVTNKDRKIKYDVLIVSLGLGVEFDKIPGLPEAIGTEGVGCNYTYETVNDTYKAIQNFKGGNALFTLPNTPIKCLGAPQKIMYLAEEIFQENDVRRKANVVFKSPLGALFGVEKYRNALLEVCRERSIQIDLFRNLISIDATKKEATFQFLDDPNTPQKTETLNYGFIHVTPPMGPLEVLKKSSIVDATGFVDINKETLQHVKYDNIFSLGDCSNLPVSKTLAAVGAQSGVLRQNIMSALEGKALDAKYVGYASCPLVTKSNKCILAEFDYSGQPRETFPVDQGKERSSMYHLKAMAMPELYWQVILRGLWNGPETYRKFMHLGRL